MEDPAPMETRYPTYHKYAIEAMQMSEESRNNEKKIWLNDRQLPCYKYFDIIILLRIKVNLHMLFYTSKLRVGSQFG